MHVAALSILTAAGVALGAPAGGADQPQRPHARPAASLAGSCRFSGPVAFRPPLTTTPRQGTDRARATGTCSGTFTDRRGRAHELSAAKTRYLAWDSGLSSCQEGVSTGGGELIFRWGTIRFRLTEVRATGASTLELSGTRGGSAGGVASVSPSSNPAVIAAQCAGGGLRSADVDIVIATSPSIFG